ncbi:MAG: hypothetical protein ACTSPV_03070 [Candidatus Hodarchaeales archaeon]
MPSLFLNPVAVFPLIPIFNPAIFLGFITFFLFIWAIESFISIIYIRKINKIDLASTEISKIVFETNLLTTLLGGFLIWFSPPFDFFLFILLLCFVFSILFEQFAFIHIIHIRFPKISDPSIAYAPIFSNIGSYLVIAMIVQPLAYLWVSTTRNGIFYLWDLVFGLIVIIFGILLWHFILLSTEKSFTYAAYIFISFLPLGLTLTFLATPASYILYVLLTEFRIFATITVFVIVWRLLVKPLTKIDSKSYMEQLVYFKVLNLLKLINPNNYNTIKLKNLLCFNATFIRFIRSFH